jgi:hypothetical protein
VLANNNGKYIAYDTVDGQGRIVFKDPSFKENELNSNIFIT